MEQILPYHSLQWCLSPVHDQTHLPNLLYEIYKSRPDLQKAFPDPLQNDQYRLLKWAQNHIAQEYPLGEDLASRFLCIKDPSLFTSKNPFFLWAISPVHRKTYIPHLLYEIYKQDNDLQKTFPDPLRTNQFGLLRWAQDNLANKYYKEDNFLSRFHLNQLEIHASNHSSLQVHEPLPKGVNLIGYSRAEFGLGESCRLAAKALQQTNIPFGIINYPLPDIKSTNLSWKHKEMNTLTYNTNIFHINPDLFPTVHQDLKHNLSKEQYNIGYWHWELPNIPEEWQSCFQFVNEIWVPSLFVLEAITKRTKLPVVHIPHCIQLECEEGIGRQDFGLPIDKFLFLSMYDVRSYQERKNPIAAIRAFQRAFPKNDSSVGLIIKINNSHQNPREVQYILNITRNYNNIYLITEIMERKRINTLIQLVDCIVSLHRSEGFGLVLAEGMYLGKPVISTNWSGNTDFMNTENSFPVNYTLVRVGKNYDPYGRNQLWAEPDINHAAHYMKMIASNPLYGREIGAKGRETIVTKLSPDVVGEMIQQRLSQCNLL